LVRKVPVINSTNKTWDEQQELLGNDEETPTAQVMVYTIIGHFLATGERLFEDFYVSCSEFASDGYRVYVGDFVDIGLDINSFWDTDRGVKKGVSSAKKKVILEPSST
jgi:hypothetical protein